MKKAYKILSILLIVAMISFTCSTVFADDIVGMMDGKDAGVNVSDIGKIGNKVFTIITNVAMVLAIIILAILGVRYMMGSAEDKSEFKKSMIPYIVGAVCVFGAGAIGRMVINVTSNIVS